MLRATVPMQNPPADSPGMVNAFLPGHTVKSGIAIRLASRISDSAIYHVDLHAGSQLLAEILGK